MNYLTKMEKFVPLLAAIGLFTVEMRVQATPYASGITNDSGTVSFILNESADNVKVVFDGGGVSNTNDLGALEKGVHTFSLGAHSTWQIEVKKSSAQVWTQISADTNVFNEFYSARSVDVNRDPASPYFGRVYVLEHSGSGGTGTTGSGRTVSRGVFALNADLTDALGQGDTGLMGGLDSYNFFTATDNRYDPWKISVGQDNYLYISDAQNDRGGLARLDGNLSTGELVLTGVGNAAAPDIHTVVYGIQARGSLADNNLVIWGIDGQWQNNTACNTLLRWDIGGGPLAYATAPTTVAQTGLPASEQDSDLDIAPDGNFFVLFYRGITTTESVKVFSPSGTLLWSSLVGGSDVFWNCRSLKVSPDNTKLAIARSDQQVWIVNLTNGPDGRVPDLSTTNIVKTFASSSSGNGRTLTWDAAGNLYVANPSSELLRVFTPGGTRTTITTSDGAFQVIVPPTIVSVTATPMANEAGPVNGVFTLTRNGDTSIPLTVNYTLSGTASNGTDYATLPLSVTFPPGSSSTNLTLAVVDDLVPELTETAILTIDGDVSYGIENGTATISILDNEPPEISFSTTTTNKLLESYAPSKVTLQLQRRGLLTAPIDVNLAYSGTATRGTDFNGPLTATIPANAVSASLTLTSINDQVYEGDELAVASVAAGAGYTIGTPGLNTTLVVDDEYPGGTVLFSDDFNTDSSSRWMVNVADPDDDFVDFAWDYSTVGVPVAPGTTDGSTRGMRFTSGNVYVQFDGLSVSPLGGNFPGDYRLKFDMWINYNGPMPDGGPGSTQNFDAGVGTTGDKVVYFNNPAADGIWFTCTGDGADGDVDGDYTAFLGNAELKDDTGFYAAGVGAGPNDGFRNASNPFYSLWGGQPAPAAQLALYPNQTGVANLGNAGMAWHTVVITKMADTVKWQIDGVTICTVTNDPGILSTNLFVGYQDKFSGGSASDVPEMSFGLVDNLRVETIGTAPITVTSLKVVGGNVAIIFAGPAEKVAADFKLQSSPTVNGTYLDDVGATLTDLGSGQFKATTAMNGDNRFYRIKL